MKSKIYLIRRDFVEVFPVGIWPLVFQHHFNSKTTITSTQGDTIAEKDKLDRILMSLRELEAWEERRDNVVIQIRKASRAERKELKQKLLNIDHQIQYYTNLVKDMKHKMKPTHVPDILNALLGHRMRDI